MVEALNVDQFRAALDCYKHLDREALRQNLAHFLREVTAPAPAPALAPTHAHAHTRAHAHAHARTHAHVPWPWRSWRRRHDPMEDPLTPDRSLVDDVQVVPVAEAAGVYMAIHPDDPPMSLLGLPRILSTADDVEFVLKAYESRRSNT